MATYYNGGEQPQFSSLGGIVQGSQYGTKPTSRSWFPGCRGLGTACAIVYGLLVTAVAVVALILGTYATDRVRSLRTEDAVLVSNPKTAPAGYTVYSLGTGLGYWSPTTDMKHSRSDHGVISYGKYAYLIGGVEAGNGTQNNTVIRSVVRYDTETGIMEEMSPLPEPRCRFGYALLNGQIYVMGGASTVGGGPTKTVFVYTMANNSWVPIGQLNTRRVDPCGAAANGKVYVFGGYDEDFISLASVEVCDPSTAVGSAAARFQQLPAGSNLKDPRGDCRAVSIDDVIYAVGGAQWFNNTKKNCTDNWVFCYRFLNSVEAFNPTSGVWTPRAPMISKRGDFGIEALPGGRIIVAGGERGDGTQNAIAMYEVEEYVVQHDIWVQKAPLPEARFRDDLAYASGRVYAFGGTPSCDLVQDAPCIKVALKTVFAYFDVQYPLLYAFFKPNNATT